MTFNFYPVIYPNRTEGGYYFKIFRLADDESVFESATYATQATANKEANRK